MSELDHGRLSGWSPEPGGAERPLRVGVIGTGRIGRLHAELLAHRVPGATVAAVYDPRAELAADLADGLGIPAADSLEELLAGELDAVAVCSSADAHAEQVIAAARAGKAVFCEKPVALGLDELDRAMAEVRAARVPFQIGFNRRFDPAHASVREAVVTGTIGQPQLLRITSRDPEPPPAYYIGTSGGLFLDMMVHDFDMARFLTGSEVVEVFARGGVRSEPALRAAGDIDTAIVMLVHADGCLTAIDNSRRSAYGFDQRVEVFGSGGIAASENPPAHSAVVMDADGKRAPRPPHFFAERYLVSFQLAWESFVEAIRSGTPTAVSVGDARPPVLIGLAAWRSLREGGPVTIEPEKPLRETGPVSIEPEGPSRAHDLERSKSTP